MKNIALFLLVFFAYCNLVYSQDIENVILEPVKFKNSKHNKIYQIELMDSPQSVELIELKNGKYLGNIILKLSSREYGIYTDKILINDEIVKLLMQKSEQIGIETITNCYQNKDCIDYLDGSDVFFRIQTNEIDSKYSFSELYPNQISEAKAPKNRKQAQEIINILHNYLDFKKSYIEMKSKLPPGRYSYNVNSRIGTIDIKE
jgi:hypothetical protein